MLTREHVIVAFKNGRACPDRLTRQAHAHYVGYAERMSEIYHNGVGRTRGELHRDVERVFETEPDCDPRRIEAFCKLLDEHSEFDTDSEGRAARLRMRVFRLAAPHHPLVGQRDQLFVNDEQQVKTEIAGKLGRDWEQIERDLYADVIQNHRLLLFRDYANPDALLARYNVAQVQGCLYSASRMQIELTRDFRTVLSQIKFARLLHQIYLIGPAHYLIVLDGPASVLRETRRYGVDMARLIPALIACRDWKLRADIRAKRNRRAVLELSSNAGLTSPVMPPDEFDSSLESRFAQKFGNERDGWRIEREGVILNRGQKTFIPDFVFRHSDGTVISLEIIGFWTPEYLRAKLETLRLFSDQRIILAVAEQNASDLGEKLQGGFESILTFKTALLIGPVIDELERIRALSPFYT